MVFWGIDSQDYECDKVFTYTSDGKDYQTRRYSFGFVTLMWEKYTFDTYRTLKYLPVEYRVDESIFFDNKTKLKIGGDLLFKITQTNNGKYLTIRDTSCQTITKKIN